MMTLVAGVIDPDNEREIGLPICKGDKEEL